MLQWEYEVSNLRNIYIYCYTVLLLFNFQIEFFAEFCKHIQHENVARLYSLQNRDGAQFVFIFILSGLFMFIAWHLALGTWHLALGTWHINGQWFSDFLTIISYFIFV